MTPTEETFDTRVKLGLTRASFASLLGVRPAQVRKWETEGQPDPSNAALAAMRMALELHECRRLPWMEELWPQAQFARDELMAMLAHAHMVAERRAFVAATQVLNAVLEQRPERCVCR
jgi:transcriptional regulator with XRE-family HTH domain